MINQPISTWLFFPVLFTPLNRTKYIINETVADIYRNWTNKRSTFACHSDLIFICIVSVAIYTSLVSRFCFPFNDIQWRARAFNCIVLREWFKLSLFARGEKKESNCKYVYLIRPFNYAFPISNLYPSLYVLSWR